MDCMFEESSQTRTDRNLAVDGLIGQAVGDAFGVPFEFLSRRKVRKLDPQENYSKQNVLK